MRYTLHKTGCDRWGLIEGRANIIESQKSGSFGVDSIPIQYTGRAQLEPCRWKTGRGSDQKRAKLTSGGGRPPWVESRPGKGERRGIEPDCLGGIVTPDGKSSFRTEEWMIEVESWPRTWSPVHNLLSVTVRTIWYTEFTDKIFELPLM